MKLPMNSSQKLIHSVYLFISIFILPQLLVAMGGNGSNALNTLRMAVRVNTLKVD